MLQWLRGLGGKLVVKSRSIRLQWLGPYLDDLVRGMCYEEGLPALVGDKLCVWVKITSWLLS